MLQQVQGVQDAKQVVEDKLQLLESRYVDVVQELQKKETQQQRWKSVIKHSNQSMHMMEADYVVLQKQVELLTKKLQMSTTADSFQMTSSSSFHNSSMNQSTSSIQRPPPTPPRTDIMDVSKMRFTSPSFKLHH